MIIEFTSGQFVMAIGVFFGIFAIINFLIPLKDLGIILGIIAIIVIICGLNVDYGFLVFKLVNP